MAQKNRSQKSVMSHRFSEVPKAQIQRSTFDRSHGLKTTFNAGGLVPILIDEVYPGDTFNVQMTGLARMATPIYPLMDNMQMETFFFAIPMRLVWDNWQRFMGEQDNPTDSVDYTIPITVAPVGGFTEMDIGDYFGLPTKIDNAGFFPIALPFRCYNLVYNQWFRDENIVDSLTVPLDDGPDPEAIYTLRSRMKRHDYFTSALPWPQKGEAVTIPLGTTAPITGIGIKNPAGMTSATNANVQDSSGNIIQYANSVDAGSEAGLKILTDPAFPNNVPQIFADLSAAEAGTINQLREAFQIQKLLERDARGGTRYIEILKSHFGVTSPDARLQRTEYLGGGSSSINIQPVAQTQASDPATVTPQGNLAAVGTAILNRHGFTKSFVEHSYILGLINVRADLTYQQGINRMWLRSTRYDFYFPALAHLGEQAISNMELFTADDPNQNIGVFGYQERWAELRYFPSQITGLFRSNATASLDAWHLSQDFGALPSLNPAFIVENPPFDRVVAVPSEPDFILDAHFSMKCARPMPLYSVPGLVDHF